MNECEICGKSIYNKISFVNLFKLDYKIHSNCVEKLQYNELEVVIPIEDNYVIYDYVFKVIIDGFNIEYLWLHYFGKLLEKHINNGKWSIVVIVDDTVEFFMKNYNPYLLFNFTKQPLLLVSLKERQLSYLEAL